MPVISIIVPVYNTEKYIHRCIDSILSQTFKDLECILIDDGSSDNCPAICDEYAVKDSRIVVIHQKNAGVSAARNAGLDIVRGEWIGFVDSDDWCDPDMFSVLYENAATYVADVSVCGYRIVTSDGEKWENAKNKLQIFNGEKAILEMLMSKIAFSFDPSNCNKLIKAIIISQNRLRYDTTILVAEDLLFLYEIFKQTKKVVCLSMPYYNYFRNTESVMRQYGLTDAAKTAFIAFDKIISLENNTKIKKAVIEYKINYVIFICGQYIYKNDYNNENFLKLKNYIAKQIIYIFFSYSLSLRQKIKVCLILYPCLYKNVYCVNKYIKNIFHKKSIH